MPNIEVPYLVSLFVKFFRGLELKMFTGLAVAALSFLFDTVYKDAMIAILILLIFDFVTGLAAVKKSGQKIESAKIFRSAIKVGVYFLLISAGRLAEISTHELVPIIDETVMGFLAVTELISILENAGKLGYAIPQKLLNRLEEYKNNQ